MLLLYLEEVFEKLIDIFTSSLFRCYSFSFLVDQFCINQYLNKFITIELFYDLINCKLF